MTIIQFRSAYFTHTSKAPARAIVAAVDTACEVFQHIPCFPAEKPGTTPGQIIMTNTKIALHRACLGLSSPSLSRIHCILPRLVRERMTPMPWPHRQNVLSKPKVVEVSRGICIKLRILLKSQPDWKLWSNYLGALATEPS